MITSFLPAGTFNTCLVSVLYSLGTVTKQRIRQSSGFADKQPGSALPLSYLVYSSRILIFSVMVSYIGGVVAKAVDASFNNTCSVTVL